DFCAGAPHETGNWRVEVAGRLRNRCRVRGRREAAYYAAVWGKRVKPRAEMLAARSFGHPAAGTEEVTELDRLAEPALRKAPTGQPSLEMRRRVQELLEQSAAAPTGEHIRQLRAVETLEHIRTADAQAMLKTLASGAANARLTREAKASLERLEKRRTV